MRCTICGKIGLPGVVEYANSQAEKVYAPRVSYVACVDCYFDERPLLEALMAAKRRVPTSCDS